MDFETFQQSIQDPVQDQWNDSSDESNFESLPDNESYAQMDSDDEFVPNQRIASSSSSRKRMQTIDKQHTEKQRKTSIASSTSGKIERLPTRRPDPKVHNRNALMARENRRRKKEHVQVLEDQLERKSQEIRCLRKILKQKDRHVKKLENETLYLRSTIANKTDIMKLLKTIRGNNLPLTSSALSFVADDEHDRRINGSEASRSPATSTATSFGDDEKENGTVTIRDDPFLPYTLNEIGFSLSDYDLGFGHPTIGDDLAMGDWRSLLNDDDNDKFTTASTKPNYIPHVSSPSSEINSEHNYYQQNTIGSKTNAADAPGICLHLSAGRISLEFCAACHTSSQDAWIEEM